MGGPHAQPLGDGAGRELGAAMYGGLEVGSSTCRGRVLMLNYSADVQALEATNQRWSRTTPRNPRFLTQFYSSGSLRSCAFFACFAVLLGLARSCRRPFDGSSQCSVRAFFSFRLGHWNLEGGRKIVGDSIH